MAASEYPRRGQFFAVKYVRMLYKVCAAQTLGPLGVNLLACIALTEDAARYRGGVTFYNGQLMAFLGITKWDTIDRAREKCIDGGFLHYVNGGKRAPGLYWVLTPERFADVDDSPMDEGTPTYADGYKIGWVDGYNSCAKQHGIEIQTPVLYPFMGDKAGIKRVQCGVQSGDKAGVNGGINRVQNGCKGGEPPILILDLEEPLPVPGPNPEIQEAASAACGEPSQETDSPLIDSTTLAVVAGPLEPSCFSFPTKGKGGKTWTLPQVKLDEYHEVYPDLDVDAQIRAARQWCRDNPTKQKTPKGMPGFLTRWLNKAQNDGGGRRPLIGGHGSVLDPRGNHAAFEMYRDSLEEPVDDSEH